jgi:dTDP-4-dehydrorhamnose reductase
MDGLVVVGGAGRLAHALQTLCPTAKLAPRPALDVTDPQSIARALDRLEPAVVINTAAVADVDRCEADPDLAYAVNAQGARNLAERCAWLDVPLIHLSTDYVFGAQEGRPFAEGDPPCPWSAYGRSKALGEALVLEAAPSACVARVAWLFGHDGDFLATMLRRAAAGEPLVVYRQIGSPTPIVGAADRLAALARSMVEGAPAPPILHLAGGPAASRREWLQTALDAHAASKGETCPAIVETGAPDFRPPFSALALELSASIFGAALDWRPAAAAAGASFRA